MLSQDATYNSLLAASKPFCLKRKIGISACRLSFAVWQAQLTRLQSLLYLSCGWLSLSASVLRRGCHQRRLVAHLPRHRSETRLYASSLKSSELYTCSQTLWGFQTQAQSIETDLHYRYGMSTHATQFVTLKSPGKSTCASLAAGHRLRNECNLQPRAPNQGKGDSQSRQCKQSEADRTAGISIFA